MRLVQSYVYLLRAMRVTTLLLLDVLPTVLWLVAALWYGRGKYRIGFMHGRLFEAEHALRAMKAARDEMLADKPPQPPKATTN